MKLGRKNLVYSMALAGIMMLFLVGYFIYMLPSLYVDHMTEQNLKSIRQQHKNYVEKRSYEDVQVRNATACYSLEIPKEGSYILIAGKLFTVKIIIRDDRILPVMEQIRNKLSFYGDTDEGKHNGENQEAEKEQGKAGSGTPERDGRMELEEEIETLAEIFRETAGENRVFPVEIQLLNQRELDGVYFGESIRYHYYTDGTVIMEMSISDADNHYTNYIAMEQTDESLILSYLPVVTPEMGEIRPVVLQSLPMLGAVLLLLVLLFSQVYSRGIVTPVVELVQHTEEMKECRDFSVESLSGRWHGRKDEIGALADTLDEFYFRIKKGYQELEEENRRQEIFLRASSHQLKTPIAAALLLTDGMINEVGRYKEKERYLPEVKQQLLSMRKMVEDILYLNHCTENMQPVYVDLGALVEGKAGLYRVVLSDKNISVEFSKEDGLKVYTDETVAAQIIDNLLSNAVKYTPEGGRIEITLCGFSGGREKKHTGIPGGNMQAGGAAVRIENFGVTIPRELLPHVMEPFVSGNHEREGQGIQSHGLGLYIASYYAKKLGASLSVGNDENNNSVAAVLLLPGKAV